MAQRRYPKKKDFKSNHLKNPIKEKIRYQRKQHNGNGTPARSEQQVRHKINSASKVYALIDTLLPWWVSSNQMNSLCSMFSPYFAQLSDDSIFTILSYCKIIPSVESFVKQFGTKVEASVCYDKDFSYFLSINTTLESIVLSFAESLKSKSLYSLAKALETNTALTSIDLKMISEIKKESARILAVAIVESVSIKKLGSIPVYDLKNNIPNDKCRWLDLSDTGCSVTEACVFQILLPKNSVLEALNLSQNLIYDSGASVIADGLAVNLSLTKLYLSKTKIGEIGASSIAKALKVNSTLKLLDLSNNEIEGCEILNIAGALEYNKALSDLNLSRNKITKDGADYITNMLSINTALRILDLRYNTNINEKSAELLANAVLKSETLELFSGIPILKLKNNNPSINELSLSDSGCKETEAHVLGNLLKMNTTLSVLELNKMDRVPSEAIAEGLMLNKAVNTILMNARIAVDDLRDENIRHLNLSCKKYDDCDIIIIATFLATNLSVTELDLSENNITDKGAEYIVNTLKENSILTLLSFVGCLEITDSNKMDLQEKWSIKIPENILSNKLPINWNVSLKQFYDKAIIIDRCRKNYDDNDTGVIAYLLQRDETLKELMLDENRISDRGLAFLANTLKINVVLQTLSIKRNRITDNGVKVLAEALKDNCSLATLRLSQNRISRVGVMAIADMLKGNTSLTALDLAQNSFGNVGIIAIADIIKTKSSFRELDLSKNIITDTGVKAISEMLLANTGLTSLGFSDSGEISEPTAKTFATRIFESKIKIFCGIPVSKLKENDPKLDRINIKSYPCSNIATLVISLLLKHNTVVKTVNITFANNIPPVTIEMFARYLLECPNIQTFNGIPILKLKLNDPELRCIEFPDSICSDIDAYVLSSLLKKNTTLKSLDLSGEPLGSRGISDVGATAIAKALSKNSTLLELYLYDNQIEDVGGRAIGEAFKANDTLKKLSLACNKIGDIGIDGIVDGLTENNTLQQLYLGGNPFSNNMNMLFKRVVKQHKSINDWGI